MKFNPLIAAVLIAAVLLVVVGAGSFVQVNQDQYYDYNAALSQSAGDLKIKVTAQEKAGLPVQNCYDASKFAGCPQYASQPYCKPETTFNARSVKVFIDGNETFTGAAYPQPSGFTISSPLSNLGAICCWEPEGACSVCSDQDRNAAQLDRAFIYTTGALPVGTSISGNEIFTLSFPQPALSPGNHTIDVYYFSETLMRQPYCNFIYSTKVYSQINGWQYGNQNQKVNNHQTFILSVTGNVQTITVDNVVFVNNTRYVCPSGTTLVQDGASVRCEITPGTAFACSSGTYNPTTGNCEVQGAEQIICPQEYALVNGACVKTAPLFPGAPSEQSDRLLQGAALLMGAWLVYEWFFGRK